MHMTNMNYLELTMKTTQCFVVLAILCVEKLWAEVKNSAIAYSPSMFSNMAPFTDSTKSQINHSTSKLTLLSLY